MSIRNILVKCFGYSGVYMISLVNGYIISFLGTAVLFSTVCAVWSFIEALPSFITVNYGKILLLASIPTGVALSIYIMVKATPHHLKKHNKQDNGNN